MTKQPGDRSAPKTLELLHRLRRAEATQAAALDALRAAEQKAGRAAVHPEASRKLKTLGRAYAEKLAARNDVLDAVYAGPAGWADVLWEGCRVADDALNHLLLFQETSDPSEAIIELRAASRQLQTLHEYVTRPLGMPDAQARDVAARAERVHELAQGHYHTVIEWAGARRGAHRTGPTEDRLAEERLELDRHIETMRVVLRSVVVATPSSRAEPAPTINRPVRVAEAAKIANMRPDALLERLRARHYPIAGPKGAYVAELTHILLTVPKKKRALEKWVTEHYPA